ncbi:MltA-interacting protein MipA [Acinetobacter calcoaceticus]|uniref:MltA-interacting protein MipA n=1 Tax=Acinetobacter calcoaceticus TaxID=471 RepID=A0A4R1X9N4_ACICA|nr:MltA-interacting protein MipA [Acinetobacter calcoaceticus]
MTCCVQAEYSNLAAFEVGPWSIYPEFGLQLNDARYNQYYFGVSPAESARSEINRYVAQHSYQPFVSLAVNYQASQHWGLFSVLSFNVLSDQQYRSPMIRSRYEIEPTLALSFTF